MSTVAPWQPKQAAYPSSRGEAARPPRRVGAKGATSVGRTPWRARLRPGWPQLITVALALLVASAPPAYLAQTGGALTIGYNIQRLQSERNTWKVRNQQLELELAKARSLAWIENEAVSRLGMRKPTQQTVVQVEVSPPPSVGPRSATAQAWSASSTSRSRPPESAAPTTPAHAWLDGIGAFLAALIVGR